TGTPGAKARDDGDFEAAMLSAARTVNAEYELPYLAHATMEPVNCLVRLGEASCQLWYGCQFQTGDHKLVADALGMTLDQIAIHTLPSGGSFGRRGHFSADFVIEAVEIAKALPRERP